MGGTHCTSVGEAGADEVGGATDPAGSILTVSAGGGASPAVNFIDLLTEPESVAPLHNAAIRFR
jgi:hypothetical protein